MQLTVQSVANQLAEVRVAGPITQNFVQAAKEPLANAVGPDAYKNRILLDLKQSDMIDTSGVNWLLTLHRRTKEQGGALVIYSIPPLVDNVLKVLRMHQVFQIAANQEEARRLAQGDSAQGASA